MNCTLCKNCGARITQFGRKDKVFCTDACRVAYFRNREEMGQKNQLKPLQEE